MPDRGALLNGRPALFSIIRPNFAHVNVYLSCKNYTKTSSTFSPIKRSSTFLHCWRRLKIRVSFAHQLWRRVYSLSRKQPETRKQFQRWTSTDDLKNCCRDFDFGTCISQPVLKRNMTLSFVIRHFSTVLYPSFSTLSGCYRDSTTRNQSCSAI